MAHPFYTVETAYRALRVNRVRSLLTILGIVIGITAIMLIVALGEGAQRLILSQVEGMGADTIVIRPGKNPKGPSDFAQTMFSDALKERDIDALKRKENVPELIAIAPVVFMSEVVTYGGETVRPTIYGWSSEFLVKVLKTKLSHGQGFDESDIRQSANVAVIGSKVRDDLFGNEDPIGRSIRIKGHNFRVVGVYSKESTSPFFNIDNVVLVPYTTAQTFLTGKNYYQEVMVQASSKDMVARTVDDIKATLREMHNITDPEKDDFYIETSEGTIKQIGTILSTLTTFLAAVVAISLVVGGIGVMNVMLVSVTERTREIGLRKALGAKNADILGQFLYEAVLLTLTGGAVGIFFGALFGYGISFALSSYLSVVWTYAFPVQATLIGIGVSALVGLVFGIYPAWKASKKSPIEALRYE